ncbi:Bifunctional adenosylcobalamin biosynthesis protein CobP [Halioglobus japonicus]|nr:Bifunctional adenosylcobalamin biosynthesis protein CobP [Halioglobus japonicus]
MMQFCELILGGARSGKSMLAEQRAVDSALELVYVATATAGDTEMGERIAHHQRRRGENWALVEEPVALADTLLQHQARTRCILVDCLTLWLSNCLHQQCWEREKARLLEVLPGLSGHIVLVSNETGLGVVPMGELSRQFVDESGFLHQQLAALCQQVTLTVAGLPLALKSPQEA